MQLLLTNIETLDPKKKGFEDIPKFMGPCRIVPHCQLGWDRGRDGQKYLLIKKLVGSNPIRSEKRILDLHYLTKSEEGRVSTYMWDGLGSKH